MSPLPEPDPLRLLAVAMLDQFAAETVQRASAGGHRVPVEFLDWVASDATRILEHTVLARLRKAQPGVALNSRPLATAVRCAVRYWISPWVVVRFASMRPLFPELATNRTSADLTVLLRGGQWRCPSGRGCAWKLCQP